MALGADLAQITPQGPTGLWRALVAADDVRRNQAPAIDDSAVLAVVDELDDLAEQDGVIDLADAAQAHLGYLARVGAVVERSAANDGAEIIDLAAARARRSVSA